MSLVLICRPAIRAWTPRASPRTAFRFPPRRFVVLGVELRWHVGADRGAPCLHERFQLGDDVGHLHGEIALLADVVVQVVELQSAVLEELDELVVAPSHRRRGRGSKRADSAVALEVGGEVPEERTGVEIGA